MRVSIVGAGVIGLTTAVAVKESFPNYEVTIFSDSFSPNTTGDGSAGLWTPYLISGTPEQNIYRWSKKTHDWFEQFWKSGLALESGIQLIPFCRVSDDPDKFRNKDFTKIVYGARELTIPELNKLNLQHKTSYQSGWSFITYTCEPVLLLPWLTKKLLKMKCLFVERKINSLEELANEGFQLIINCTGLGAKELVHDKTVVPIRGQVFRVQAPWVKQGFSVENEDSFYIIPNINSIVLGGTHQENDYDCSERASDSKHIYEGCCRINESLKDAKILKQWVGLRPSRPAVRLDSEILKTPENKEYTVIHNYGHGGSGVTLCWGCAVDVVGIMKNSIAEDPKSKL
ncbi:D-aspartate oxidase [Prorops nasuta]|uniref:D-aspartate oxidase n=1 Tax=Prorops nasuta TaxID=863751 RepID=UPI0034CE4888